MIRFTSGSLFKVISLCKSGRRYSDEKIAEMLFPNVEYTTNYIGHVKDCTKNLPDEITQYMSDTDQEEIIDTLNRAVRKVFLLILILGGFGEQEGLHKKKQRRFISCT